MKTTDKTELFERIPVPRAVMSMVIPTIISSLVMVIYNLADTYFVGMLGDPAQNAAVTLASPVMLAFYAVTNLFGVGSSSMMSRALGVKDFDTVHQSSAFGFYCALICGLLYSLILTIFRSPLLTLLGAGADTARPTASYLLWTVSFGAAPAILNVVFSYLVRAEGSSLHASIGTMSGCLLNIILDPIFILPWGLNMGAAGAGLATFLSNCVALGYFFVLLYVKRKSTHVRIEPSFFKPSKHIVSGVCSVGIPAAIQNLLNVTGMTVLNNFSAAYGSQVVAAMGIAQRVNQVPFQINMGFSQGIMPLVGYTYANGNTGRMKKTLFFSGRIMISFLILVSIAYYLGAELLIRLFMNNEAIISLGASFLHGFCLVLPFMCMDFLAVGVFQACGLGHKSLIFAILRKIVLEIPALYILNTLWPMYGLAYAQLVAEVVLACAALFELYRLFQKLEKRDAH